MSNNIAVSITADVADLQVKRAIMSAELKAATKDLNTFAKEAASTGSTSALREGMLASAGAAEKAKASIAQMNVELAKTAAEARQAGHAAEEGGHGFIAMGHEIHEAAESVRTFQMRAKEFAEVYVAMFAVEKVVEFAKQMGEAAEKTKHTAEQFGMTVPEVQKLQGVATQTGISIDSLTRGFGIMDKNLVTAKGTTSATANAFKAMGVSIDDGRTQMQKFAAISDKFKEMEDGPKKAALAMLLFGKSGKELIPILNLGAEGIAEMNKRTEEYGGVSEDANAKGVALAESINESKLAFDGVNNVLTSALAPVLKTIVDSLNTVVLAFIKSYKEGGFVAIAFQAITTAVEEVGAVVNYLAGVFSALWDAVSDVVSAIVSDISDAFGVKTPDYFDTSKIALILFKDAFIILKDEAVIVINVIKGLLIGLIDVLALVGKIAWDAFNMNWGAIAADWQSGLNTLKSHALKTANEIKESYADLATTVSNALQGKGPAVKEGGIPELKEGTGDGPELGATHKAKKAKTDKGPSDVEIWKQQLAEKLLLEENWGVNEAAFSLAFWEQKLKLAKKGSKEELELRHEVSTLKRTLGKEETQEELARIRELTAAAIDSAKTDVDVAKLALQSKIQAAEEAAKAGQISALRLAQIKRELNAELYQLDADLENRTYALKLKSLQADLAVAHLGEQQKKLINDQIELLNTQHQNAMTVANAKGNKDRARDDAAVADAQRARWTGVAKTFGDALGQMATFQKSFAATVNGLWQSLLGGVSQVISRMVTNWITSIAMGEAAEFGAHLRLVAMHAKTAAASAWKAVVGIPIIGPILAPIAAATAFAGVMAFSAEGGMDRVPYDGAHLIAHKDEMVLSAQFANPLRDMLKGGGWRLPANVSTPFTSTPTASAANNNSPNAANDGSGGNTYNFHVTAMDGQSVKRVLMDNKHHVADAVSKSVRDGFRG
jgi:hypothetical protein